MHGAANIDSPPRYADTGDMSRALASIVLLCIGISVSAQEKGIASFYAGKFQGRLTANGETFDTNRLTAAHKTLPFNTIIRVTNDENGRMVIVRINDRGPFVPGRVIDLSRAAADAIDMVGAGVAPVSVEVLLMGDGRTYHKSSPPSHTVKIQVGAFQVSDNAEKAIQALSVYGLDAEVEQHDGGVARVYVTDVPYLDLELTKTLLKHVGYPGAFVRR